jgi:MFS family permease
MSRLRALIPALPRDAWVVLGADALSAVGTGLTLPFLLVYLHDVRGIPLAVAGLAVSMVAGGSVVGNLAGGALCDRVGARSALIAGLTIAAAGAALLTLVGATWHAFAATATTGLGAGIAWPAQDALLAGVVNPAQRSAVFSVRLASMNAGLGLGALVAAFVVDGSSVTFVVLYLLDAMSFLAVIPLLLTVAVPARRAARARAGARKYLQVIADKTFVRVWALTALLVALSYGQLNSAFPVYATESGGVSAGVLGLAFAANTVTVVFAQPFVLRAMRGRRRTTGILVACAGWGLAWALALAAGHLGSDAIAAFILAVVVFGVAETFLAPTLTPIVNDLAPSGLNGRYNGLYTLAWTSGFLAGPAIAGVTLDSDHGSALFLGLILACAAAAAGTLRLQRHLPEHANTIAA